MVLNSTTLNILKSLSLVNDSIIIRANEVTTIKNSGGSLAVIVNLPKFMDNQFFNKDVGLLRFKEFLDLISFVGNDADIQLNEQGVLTISKDNISCNYVTTDSKVLEDICSVNSKGLDAIRHNSEKIAEFDFNEIDKLVKASTLLNFNNAILEINDSSIKISTFENNNSFNIVINSNINATSNTSVLIDIRTIKKIPILEYHFEVYKHLTKNNTYLFKLYQKNASPDDFLIPIPSVSKEK